MRHGRPLPEDARGMWFWTPTTLQLHRLWIGVSKVRLAVPHGQEIHQAGPPLRGRPFRSPPSRRSRKVVRTLPSLIPGLVVDIVGSADEANFRVKAVSKDRSDETLEPNYNVSDRRLRYVRRNSDASQVLLSNSCQFPRRSRIPCRDRSLPLALGPHIRREYHAPVLMPVLHHTETQTSMGKDMDGDQEVLTDLASFCAFR